MKPGVAHLALAVALASLALSVYQLVRPERPRAAPAVSTVASSAAAESATSPAPGTALWIGAAVRSVEQRLDRLEAGRGATAGTGGPDAARPAAGAALPSAPTRYVEFTTPFPGLAITQSESGALSVQNRDPRLAGKMATIHARTADGTMKDLAILIPPP